MLYVQCQLKEQIWLIVEGFSLMPKVKVYGVFAYEFKIGTVEIESRTQFAHRRDISSNRAQDSSIRRFLEIRVFRFREVVNG